MEGRWEGEGVDFEMSAEMAGGFVFQSVVYFTLRNLFSETKKRKETKNYIDLGSQLLVNVLGNR